MGKWSKLQGRYPRYPGDDQKFIARVMQVRDKYSILDLQGLISHFIQTRARKDELKDELEESNVSLEALGQLLTEQLEAQDLHSVRTDAGQTLYRDAQPYASVTDRGQLEKFIDLHEDLQYLYGINWQSLNTLVKELLEKGQDDRLPPGVNVFIKTGIRLRKN